MKNKREKYMLFGLLGFLALWQGQALVRSIFFTPVENRKQQIASIEQMLEKKNLDKRKLDNARVQLKKWADRSLPPDPVKAQTLYQDWLRDLAGNKAKLTDVTVDEFGVSGGINSTDKTFTAIKATVKAKGTLDKLLDFLHAFHQSGIMHRVNQLTIESAKHEGNPELAITMKVEALSMPTSKERTTLLADAAHPPKPDKPLKDRREYDPIVKKNLFVATFKPPAPEKPDVRPIPERLPDTAAYVRLTASINGTEAWLFDQTANKRTELSPGSQFSVGGAEGKDAIEGKVISITNAFVVVEIKGKQFRLELGDNLRQLRDI